MMYLGSVSVCRHSWLYTSPVDLITAVSKSKKLIPIDAISISGGSAMPLSRSSCLWNEIRTMTWFQHGHGVPVASVKAS